MRVSVLIFRNFAGKSNKLIFLMREKKTFCFEKVQEANKDLLVDAFRFGSYPAKQK